MEIFTLENSSEESSVCVSILCSEAGNDTKISNFTPHPASPLNFSLWSVDSSRTGTVAVEELFYFLYWLPVNRLFFPFQLCTFVGDMFSLNTRSWSLSCFLPQTTPCNGNKMSPIYTNLPVSRIAWDRMRLKPSWKITLFQAKTMHKQYWFPSLPITNLIKFSNLCKIIHLLAKKCSFYESTVARDVLKHKTF